MTVNPQGPVTFDDSELVIEAVLKGVGRDGLRTVAIGDDCERSPRSDSQGLVSDFSRLLPVLPKLSKSVRCFGCADQYLSQKRSNKRPVRQRGYRTETACFRLVLGWSANRHWTQSGRNSANVQVARDTITIRKQYVFRRTVSSIPISFAEAGSVMLPCG